MLYLHHSFEERLRDFLSVLPQEPFFTVRLLPYSPTNTQQKDRTAAHCAVFLSVLPSVLRSLPAVCVGQMAVAPLDVVKEPARKEIEDVQEVLLLVLVHLFKVDLSDLFHKAQVQRAMTETVRIADALGIRLLARKMRAGIGGKLIEDRDDLILLILRRILHHELVALVRQIEQLCVLLIDRCNPRQIVIRKLILHGAFSLFRLL